jgi:hypothetical protein
MSLSKKPAVSRKKATTLLDFSLDHKLLSYAAAAGAAGVSLLALAQPSEAEIVYTATHQTLSQSGSLPIDLNNDGITDFTINNGASSCSGPSCVLQQLVVSPSPPNRVWVTYGGNSFARALLANNRVGPGDKFGSAFVRMDRCKATRTSFYLSGSWPGAKNLYLGLAFSIDGQTHFGWARLSVFVSGRRFCAVSAILTGYAYETEGGKAIATGKKSGTDKANSGAPAEATLGALAVGSAGLVAWRREEETGSSEIQSIAPPPIRPAHWPQTSCYSCPQRRPTHADSYLLHSSRS